MVLKLYDNVMILTKNAIDTNNTSIKASGLGIHRHQIKIWCP